MNIQKRAIQAAQATNMQTNAITMIDLHGRLDAHQSKAVDNALIDHIEEGSQTIVNLRGVHFIDSTGLAILVRAVKRHREQSGELLLCELQQPVQIILELTKLERVFSIYPTEAAALQSLQLQQSVLA
ncbi:MAG: STAS domain-containing protein [Caldilineaceae bacterium]|nr:STAS domain-containing protein [Caldilineaceae bacterium]